MQPSQNLQVPFSFRDTRLRQQELNSPGQPLPFTHPCRIRFFCSEFTHGLHHMEPAASVWNIRPPCCACLDHWATISDGCLWWQDRNDVSDSRFCSSVVRFETQNSLRSSIGERVRPTKPEFELIDTATFDLKLTGFDGCVDFFV